MSTINSYVQTGHNPVKGLKTGNGESKSASTLPTREPTKLTTNARKAVTGTMGKPLAIGLDDFGLRLGTIKSLAANMYARRNGATLAEVKAVTGAVQFNVLCELAVKGYPIERIRVTGANGHYATRYYLGKK